MATKYRFSIEEFERIFADVRNIELLEGEIYQMSPIGPKHNYKVMRLNHQLSECYGKKAGILVQGSIRLLDKSEPQPDLVLLKPPIEQYEQRLPQASDVLLVVEVSDSTLEYDQTTKLAVYAKAGIPEYWIVNLIENVLEVYRNPSEAGYQTQLKLNPGEAVEFMGERLEVI